MAERFNPFDFIQNRYKSIPPTDSEIEGFDLYMTNNVLSMSKDPCVPDVLRITNTIKFSHLSKKQQCLAFTSLNGKYLAGKWVLPKREKKEASKEFIDKVMLVLDCSHSEAQLMVKMNQVDPKHIEACMITLFDVKKPTARRGKNDGTTNKSDNDRIRG